jgi:ABC-type antimicrobial peptide transport system permease subunit
MMRSGQFNLIKPILFRRRQPRRVLQNEDPPRGRQNCPPRSLEFEEIDKDQPIYNVRTMDEVVASSTQVRRFRTVLLSLLAVFALALAAVGTYGVMAYTVAQRRNEIGIRLALGAQPGGVRRLVIGEGLRLAGYGIVAGLLASLALSRFLSGILYGVKSTDPASFVMPPLLLLTAAFLASYIPARRAVRVDPATILRSE